MRWMQGGNLSKDLPDAWASHQRDDSAETKKSPYQTTLGT